MDDGDGTIDLGEKGFTFKEIVMRSFREAGDVLSKEFRGGFYMAVSDKTGSKEVYIDDSREVACNTVYVLAVYLIPKFDADAKKFFEKFVGDLKKMEDKFIGLTETKEVVVLGSDYYDDDKEKLELEQFKILKLRLHLDLFKAVSELLGRKNYLEMGGGSF